MIEFGKLTIEEYQLVREIISAARLHLQYGRDIDKTLCIDDIQRAEKALMKAVCPARSQEHKPTPVLEEVQTKEGLQLCQRIS